MSFKVKSLYEYASGHDDDLPFSIGQIITVTEEVDDDWYSGEYIDDAGTKQEGMFPRNFVEKFEPVAPPRPTRTRPPKKESEPAPEEPAAPVVEEPTPAPAPPAAPQEATPVSSPPQRATEPVTPASPPAPKAAQPVQPSSPPRARTEPVAQSPPKEAPAKRGPPPVTEKPATVSNSFKDRIAAFNKSSAPPIAPFKPSGLGGAGGSSSFIKKPFVAPPPKGNTYVPTQRNAPVAPVYRRDEDPEIKEREAENTENAQKAGLLPSETKEADDDEPKPMSLKERMALLQRQQQEQAARHAEASAKKEKPKRPAAKPRMLSNESAVEGAEEDEAAPPAPLERRDSEASGKPSLDEPRPPRVPAQPRRKPSIDPEPRDGNEADMSGAGETTDNQEEDLTEREDSDEKPPRPSRVSTAPGPAAADEEQAADDEDTEEEAEEDEETAEFRRKEELRARMARLGGGMGMPGMFGMPMPGAGAPALPAKKKKPSSSSDKPRTSEDSQLATSPRAPAVPTMMALPGMGRSKQPEEEPADDEDDEDEPAVRSPPAGETYHTLLKNTASSTNKFIAPAAAGGAPPIPGGRPAPPPVPAECMYGPSTPQVTMLTKLSPSSAATSSTRW